MTNTLREVALDKDNINQLFAERLESEVTSEYLLMALIAEMSMTQKHSQRHQGLRRERATVMQRYAELLVAELDDAQELEQLSLLERVEEIDALLQKPAYVPMSRFSVRAKAMEQAKQTVGTFQVVGPQRPVNNE